MNHGYACSKWHNHRLTQWWYCDKGPPTRAFDVSMWPVPSTHITAGSLNNRLNFKWLRYLCVHRLYLIVENVVLVGQLRTQKPLNRFLRSHVVATWQSYKAFSYCLIVQYLLNRNTLSTMCARFIILMFLWAEGSPASWVSLNNYKSIESRPTRHV